MRRGQAPGPHSGIICTTTILTAVFALRQPNIYQIRGRVQLSAGERKSLAEIGKPLGKQALAEVATLVKPDTILAWHRKLVAQKFDGSQQRKALGRPKIDEEPEAWCTHGLMECPHQGVGHVILMPAARRLKCDGPLRCRQRLGGLLKYDHRDAA